MLVQENATNPYNL